MRARVIAFVAVAAACGPRAVAPRAPMHASGTVVVSPPPEPVTGMIVRPYAAPARLPPTAPVPARATPRTTMATIPLPDPLIGTLPLDDRPYDEQIAYARAELKRTRGEARLDVHLRLVGLLQEQAFADPRDARFATYVAEALAASRALVAARGFAAYRRAPEALYRLGLLARAGGDPAAARAALEELVARFPDKLLAYWALVRLADDAFDDGDLPRAARHYRLAIDAAGAYSSISGYARYRRAWVHVRAGEMQEAMNAFVELARGYDPPASEVAPHDVVAMYAQIGKADQALDFLKRVEPGSARALAAELAVRYLDAGKYGDAAAVYDALAASEPDAALACPHLVGAYQARLAVAPRRELLQAADRIAGVHPTGACQVAADALLGEVAWAWQVELPRSEARRLVVRAWDLALVVASSPARAAVMARNRAELVWEEAGYRRGAAAWMAAWTDAGDAFLAAAGRDPDPALVTAAVDAYDNALRVRARGEAAMPAAVAARVRAGLARVTGAERTRAATLAAALR